MYLIFPISFANIAVCREHPKCASLFLYGILASNNNEITNRQGRQERQEKRFLQGFCVSPVPFGKIGMLPVCLLRFGVKSIRLYRKNSCRCLNQSHFPTLRLMDYQHLPVSVLQPVLVVQT